ncbi:MAG: bifunctional phosphopantothenoylcysteine decarboxylase/phosphopantothenate--cysteine ligase CoaBC [Bacteroidota bacterium]
MISGKKILIGITGSISAYKTITLIRLLVKKGADVRVVITSAAKDFVSPMVLSTFSNHKVYHEFVENDIWENHVILGRWADLFLIVPASCNTISKMATGLCDNFLMATYLSATCKTVIVPAMDEEMWLHPSTQNNIKTLASYGNDVIEPREGLLASGLIGKGRLPEPEELVTILEEDYFRSNELAGKNILITAGPTEEPIDPVRFITNRSSGKMGFAIAEVLYLLGANVKVVSGPVSIETKYKGIQIVEVQTAKEMFEICKQEQEKFEIGIFSAAVADYTIAHPENEKIKKQDENLNLSLSKTKDILGTIGDLKRESQKIIGFALETNNGEKNAISKLKNKHADLIVLNMLNSDNNVFNNDFNKVSFIEANENIIHFNIASKNEVALKIADYIISNWK